MMTVLTSQLMQLLFVRSQLSVGKYIRVPPYCLERTFELAEKKDQVPDEQNKENQSNKEVQFRFMQNLTEIQDAKERISNTTLEETKRSNSCAMMKNSGFKVRAFMVYTLEEDKEGIMVLAGKSSK